MPVGTGINHQAVVTLYEIYPLTGENEQEMIAFLKLQSQKIDVEFISYTAESGSLVRSCLLIILSQNDPCSANAVSGR